MKLNFGLLSVFVGIVSMAIYAVPAPTKALIPQPTHVSKNQTSPEATNLLKNLGAAQVRAFAVENILIRGIPQDGPAIWTKSLDDTDLFIKNTVDTKKGIREATKKRFNNVRETIRKLSDKFFKSVDNLRAVSFNFKKEKYADLNTYFQGKTIFEYDKDIINGFKAPVKELQGLQQGLGSEYGDNAATLEVKKLLTFLASALELAYNKVIREFGEIQNDIRVAIDKKKASEPADTSRKAGFGKPLPALPLKKQTMN